VLDLKGMLRKSYLVFILFVLATLACKTHDEHSIHRGFYYWKSRFALDHTESSALQKLRTEKLYIKFFDVGWDEVTMQPAPIAKIQFSQKPPSDVSVMPVVFITNETLQQCNADQLTQLALKIPQLLSSQLSNNELGDPKEIQIDCDWTATTKDKYFLLLQLLKKTDLFKDKTLSVTIRLHQVKYRNETGVPPADRGLLMCYNMGNLTKPQTKNSIIETSVLEQYIGNAKAYPLPLDMALPLFDWWVWFRENEYMGLVYAETLQPTDSKKWRAPKDTSFNGYNFKAGDWLRYEGSDAAEIDKAIGLLKAQRNCQEQNIILYHLDAKNLAHYDPDALERFYTGFAH
jgi:hypothetical protein